jgi:N6-adenosine-specific RNA methylase IME4
MNLPTDKKYNIIYADPPWNFKVWSKNLGKYGRCPDKHYSTMNLEDIKSLSVPANENCALFLWVTYPMLQEGFEVINAWGFTYRTCAFTWVKTTLDGNKFPIGLGYWTRANPELCLLATKGRILREDKGVRNLVISPRREHSRKPDEVRDMILRLVGDLPRIELFARQKTDGWDVWGNEV